MKAVSIEIEITNFTLKENVFLSFSKMTFDNAYKQLKKQLNGYDFIVENIKCRY